MLLAAALRAETGVSNGWLCERLGMGTPASVSQFVRRWLMVAANAKAVARLRATVGSGRRTVVRGACYSCRDETVAG